jgi:hypothetical protein
VSRAAEDALIDAAVQEGKFPPARAAHYRRLMEADPEGTQRLIAKLEPGIPLAEKGAIASVRVAPPTDYPRQWLRDVKPATGRVIREEF